MNDPERNTGDPAPQNEKKHRRAPLYVLSVALICLLVVLVLANLPAILKPFQKLNSIFAPITIGLAIAYLANPLLRLFEFRVFIRLKKRRLNRALSLVCTYLIILVMIVGVIWLIVPQIVNSISDLRENGMVYVDNIIDSVNRIIRAIPFLEENPENLLSFEKLLNYFLKWIDDYNSSVVGFLGSFAGGVLTVLKNILVGFFVSVYVLLSKDRLNAGCRRVFRALLPKQKETMLLYYIGKAHRKFGGFFIGKIIDSLIIGILSWIIFAIFKIPYAVLVAVIVGVTNVIPFFGPFIGAIPSAMIIFIKDPMKALLFCVLILAIQQFDGNILGPFILGGSTGLSSLGILVSITVASGLLGFAGMLVGVPLFALLMAMLDDWITLKLKKRGRSARLCDYYPADAFIKPNDPDEQRPSAQERFRTWVLTVETERAGVDYTPSLWHKIGRFFRKLFLRAGRFFRKLPRLTETAENTADMTENIPEEEFVSILPKEPEKPESVFASQEAENPSAEADGTGDVPQTGDAGDAPQTGDAGDAPQTGDAGGAPGHTPESSASDTGDGSPLAGKEETRGGK